MPNKAEPLSQHTAIRWTDDEWATIAQRLYAEKGSDVLQSDRLEEIKAKDVFVAQDVLPIDRHRKLVSIAQGFEGIRSKLRSLLEKIDESAQAESQRGGQKADAGNRGREERKRTAAPRAAATAETSEAVAESGTDQDETTRPASDAVGVAPNPGAGESAHEPASAAPAMATAGPANERTQVVARPEPVAPSQHEMDLPASTPVLAAPSTGNPESRSPVKERQDRGPNNPTSGAPAHGRPRPEKDTEAAPDAARADSTAAAGADFIDIARPFVAMVCEEFTRALVKALSQKETAQALRDLVQGVTGLSPSAEQNRSSQQPRRPESQNQQQRNNRPKPAEVIAAAPEAARTPHQADNFDDENGPADVQPLFDPKLPPSANSEFKPMIGLVGATALQVDDLRQRYPQLQLMVVPVDAVRSGNVFRQCQRIIGLGDEMPPVTDEFLRHSLRSRYVRLVGGIERVKEQLNYWLDKPASMNARPPRGPLQRNRNGKKPNKDGGFNKQRQNRRPQGSDN